MTAIDTNALVRFLVADHPKQAAAAKALFASGKVWIAKTVLLKTAWVLRATYGFEEPAIRDAFVKLIGLRNVEAEDSRAVQAALALVSQGLEFADALHLQSQQPGLPFATFDRTFARRASRAGVESILELPKA